MRQFARLSILSTSARSFDISIKKQRLSVRFCGGRYHENVPYHKIDSGSLTPGLWAPLKFYAKDQTNIARIKNTVTARLLLRRGDYKRARLYYLNQLQLSLCSCG